MNPPLEICVVELIPGNYWLNSGVAVDDPTQATRVDPWFDPKHLASTARVVHFRVTVQETNPFDAYSKLWLDWVAHAVVRNDCTADDEQRYARDLEASFAKLSAEEKATVQTEQRSLMTHRWKVYVDDERPVPQGWLGSKTAAGAILVLQHIGVSHLSLDHDLGEGRGTGYEIACWLEDAVITRGHPMPTVTIHSGNPVGRANIQRVLDAIARWRL